MLPLPEDLIPALRPILVSALAQSPQMIAHDIDIANAEGVRISDRAGLLPNANANLQYGDNNTSSSYATTSYSSSSLGMFYNASANQPLYHWGALKARAEIGRIGVRIAGRQYAEAYRQLIVSVRTQFMALIAKKLSLGNADFALHQAEEELASVREKMKARTLSPGADVYSQIAVDDARLTRDRTIEDLENSERVFALCVGRSGFGTQDIPDAIPRPAYAPEAVDRLLQRFVQREDGRTFEIANMRDEIRQAELDYRIARVQLRPNIGLNAFFSQQAQTSVGPGYLDQFTTRSANFSIVANWSLFDGLATRGAKLSSLSRKRSLERSLQTTVDQTMNQVRDMATQIGFSWRGLNLNQQRRDLAESHVNDTIDFVKRGQLSASDVGAARMGLQQLELALIAARADYLNEWSLFVSTLCVDPMLDVIPNRYFQDGQ
jgi:outer membrane protein TolC